MNLLLQLVYFCSKILPTQVLPSGLQVIGLGLQAPFKQP
jgi:hypothetical protein